MTSSTHSGADAGAIRISRSEAISKLKDLRAKAAQSRFGNGQMFSARWVAVGDEKTGGPYVCHKSLRFQVRKHLKGGEMSFAPEEQGYLGVYEMVNRARAVKLFKAQAQHRLDGLQPQLQPALEIAQQAATQLQSLDQAATQAATALQAVETAQATYATKKAYNEALKQPKATKREADRAVRDAFKASQRANRILAQLEEKIADEQLKLDDPESSLKTTIEERIARYAEKLAQETDADEKTALAERLELERDLLADPIRSLMARYRLVNLNGLISLQVQGQVYEVTTRPVPAIPENAAEETDDDDEAASNAA